MKKLSTILIILALVVLIPAGTVMGQAKTKVKGEITLLEDGSMELITKDGSVTVIFPDDYDTNGLEVGLIVMVDGSWLNDENFKADAIKIVDDQEEYEDEGKDIDDEDVDDKEEDEDSEDTFQNAFCTGEKDTLHPLAAKIVERFGETGEEEAAEGNGEVGDTQAVSLTEEQVMTWFCEGHSFGQIMLALVTQKFDGSDPQETLQMRKEGKGWGNIWKEKGLIGNASEGTPPGQIIKPDKADKSSPPGLDNKPDKENKIPPGQEKKTPTP